jgi:hypothetical protein
MNHKSKFGTQPNIITVNELTKAIINRLGIDKEEAIRIAGFVLDMFGFEDRVIDNILDLEGRQLFYLLEEEGMIISGREETILHNGREWLTHYWQIQRGSIIKYAKNGFKRNKIKSNNNHEKMKISGGNNIYSSITREMWNARNIERKKPICYFFIKIII